MNQINEEILFETKIGDSTALCDAADTIRQTVFIDERGVPDDEVFDGLNDQAIHIVVFARGEAVATARLLATTDGWKIGLVAVFQRWRGHQLGQTVVEAAINYVVENRGNNVYLMAHQQVIAFYEKYGFKRFGEPTVFESGFMLFPMKKALT